MFNILALMVVGSFFVTVLAVDNADARRFGGGMSFGKKHRVSPRGGQRNFTPRQTTSAKPNGMRGSARPGLMGMMGGLAMGGLLGAMFFGGGFSGINLFDILVLAALAMALIWLFKRMQRGYGPAAAPAFSATRQPSETARTVIKPCKPELDQRHFLNAARDIFIRMQRASDSHNLEDIRKFCTPEVADQVRRDIGAQGDTKSQTEVATLHADIAESWIESDLEWVSVHFTAMLREQELDTAGKTLGESTQETHEYWIFRHDPALKDPTWYLAGIQQAV